MNVAYNQFQTNFLHTEFPYTVRTFYDNDFHVPMFHEIFIKKKKHFL